ncbi:MAG: restriction endonuclease subunit S [Bacteroidales bacterium]|nr:restriction endonuclease subunit S [Bacteroidales bacterium]
MEMEVVMSEKIIDNGELKIENDLSEWKEVRLGEISQLEKDSWKVGDEELPYIALEHIVEGGLRLQGIGDSNTIASNKFRFNSDCFLFGKLRPYFRKLFRPNFEGICSTDIWVVKPKGENDKDFLFYFFANQEFVDFTYSGSSGTRMPRADWKFVGESKWNFPEPTEQKAIAEVLSSLDDKIDLLHRQNKTLEQMAETLFRQWFMEDAKDDWEEVVITDLFEVRDGTHDSPKKKETGKKLITSKHLKNNYIDFQSAYYISQEDYAAVNKRSKVEIKDILFSMIGTIGNIYIEESENIDYAIKNVGLFKSSQNKDWCYFTYLWLKSELGKEFIHENRSGSTQEYISLGSLRSIIFKISSKNRIFEFNTKVQDYFSKIKSNQQQIRTLEKLRDTLLPKLMSGEVRVKN